VRSLCNGEAAEGTSVCSLAYPRISFEIGHILAFLKKNKPEDAFCIVGITMIDLYPRDSWNFVFGQASLSSGIPFATVCMSFILRGLEDTQRAGKINPAGNIFNH
jgi:predicted Zn-dependent protease